MFIAGVWLAFFGLLAMYVAAALLTRLPTESTVPGLGPNVGVAALLVDVVLVFQSGGFLTLAGGFVLLLLGGRMITALV